MEAERVAMERKVAMVEYFQRLNAPVFNGTGSAEEAEQFVRQVEKILRLLRGTDAEKLAMAEYQLQGEADKWWITAKETVVVQPGESEWENFKALFASQFFSEAKKEAKAREFEELVQGNLTFEQYGREFLRLSRYAPNSVTTSKMRARRFEHGVNSPLREKLVALHLPTFEEVFRRGLCMERIRVNQDGQGNSSGAEGSRAKRARGFYRGGGNRTQGTRARGSFSRMVSRPVGMGSGRSGGRLPPRCRRCGRRHEGTLCFGRPVTCFKCGIPGHIRYNCPQRP